MRKHIIAGPSLHPSPRRIQAAEAKPATVLASTMSYSREINKRENVILFNKPEADEALHHLRQAVQEGYITTVRFFLTCHVEI